MKVHEDQAPLLHQTSKKVTRKVDGANDFQKIMEEKMVGVERKDVQNGPSNIDSIVNGVQILQGTQQVRRPPETLEHKPVLDEIQKTLDLVDFYAEKLGNTSLPVTGLDPLVDHLEKRLEGLKGMESNPELPDKLRPILSDVVMTMGTEIAKFKRGDYS